MEPGTKKLISDESSVTLILDDAEFVKNLYMRYFRIRVETMIEIAGLIALADSKEAALRTLQSRTALFIHKTTMNSAEIVDMSNRLYKRGNLRKKSFNI